ncbi:MULTISPECIES: YppE family protein [unclassified Bacillus (in: firmicutes)]|uniref:YppE family protein n=1 Tax=unclassified Bacillus (in: firmicutes) TaxID=185979 RepID=UPI0008EC3B0A|nr:MULTISPECIES: YppE family protein [unclassified Bacillus (in: firmicutes)]SFA98957.1 protein of unknown function [Bacillus sp. UNCCL13]SFQ81374.1 protein of unknown function [Bacillus sp. cl95]
MTNELLTLTMKLLRYNDELMKRFEHTKETGKDPDFFVEVKPFVDEVKKWNDQWLEHVTVWVKQERPRQLYMNQIESTHNHLEQISVQAFYSSSSKKRFIDASKSIEFVLKTIIQKLSE